VRDFNNYDHCDDARGDSDCDDVDDCEHDCDCDCGALISAHNMSLSRLFSLNLFNLVSRVLILLLPSFLLYFLSK
jgi:hypothetical protein